MWGLQTLNPNVLELKRLWHEHGYAAAVRLLDVASPDLLERLPVKVSMRPECRDAQSFSVVGRHVMHSCIARQLVAPLFFCCCGVCQ